MWRDQPRECGRHRKQRDTSRPSQQNGRRSTAPCAARQRGPDRGSGHDQLQEFHFLCLCTKKSKVSTLSLASRIFSYCTTTTLLAVPYFHISKSSYYHIKFIAVPVHCRHLPI